MALVYLLMLPFSVLDLALLLLVSSYDKFMYSPLQNYLVPRIAKIPREVIIGKVRVTVFTANGVTFARTTLVVIMALCLKYDYTVLACLLVLLNDIMDHLDGIVAKAQRKVYGDIDSPILGAFLDAFCDKVVNVLLLWTILLLTDFASFSPYQFVVFVGVCCSVIGFETVLGIVRIQDYYKAKYVLLNEGASSNTDPNTVLRAGLEGKTKEKLENVGLSLVCLGMANTNLMKTWVGCVGILCLALSLRFAYSSLKNKIHARRRRVETELSDVTQKFSPACNGTVTQDDVFELRHQNVFIANGMQSLTAKQRTNSAPTFTLNTSDSDSSDSADCQHMQDDQTKGRTKKVDKIYTVGCFDLFHKGHKILLKNMRNLGKEVIVGIHDDESYFKLKKKYAIDNIEKRMSNVKQFADQVFVISNIDPTPYLRCCIHLQPSQTALYVRGDDMPHFPGRPIVEPMMPIQLLPYTRGVSSTQLRAELSRRETPKEK